MLSSTSTTPPTAHSNLDTTSSPISPTTRDPNSLVTLPQTPPKNQSGSSQPTPTPLTGSPLEPSPQSRTRDNADHAGPSPPPEPSRVPTRSPLEPFFPSLSSKSSTALTSSTDTQALDAMVETNPLPSNISRPTRPNWNPSTHTLPRTEPAHTRKPLPPPLKSAHTPTSPPTMLSR